MILDHSYFHLFLNPVTDKHSSMVVILVVILKSIFEYEYFSQCNIFAPSPWVFWSKKEYIKYRKQYIFVKKYLLRKWRVNSNEICCDISSKQVSSYCDILHVDEDIALDKNCFR